MSDVYRVDTLDAAYILKIYLHNRHSMRAIEAEVDFLNDLLDHDIPVAAPVANNDAVYLNKVDAPEGIRYAVLFDALADPTAFASSFPIPSLSLDHPQWSTDMWRGATWINYNYLVGQALRARGYRTEAKRLADTTLAVVRREYIRFGVLFEFFDATSRLSPPECDRKGVSQPPYDIRRKFDSIRDYHWTAALCLSLLFQRERGIL